MERGDNTVRLLSLSCLAFPQLGCLSQYGGKYVINPSGGLEAKGHPLGASGLGMHFYIMSEFTTTPIAVLFDKIILLVQLRECKVSRMKSFVCYHKQALGAGPMQAPGLFDISDKRGKYGLVHNIGLGGAVVVSLLRRPEFYKPGGPDGRTR